MSKREIGTLCLIIGFVAGWIGVDLYRKTSYTIQELHALTVGVAENRSRLSEVKQSLESVSASVDWIQKAQETYSRSILKGIGSYYAEDFHGLPTSSREIFDMNALTAAHKELPFGTIVEVENLRNGQKTVLRINDRGPFVDGRIIDLSKEGARRIGMIQDGVIPVVVRVLWKPLLMLDIPIPRYSTQD